MLLSNKLIESSGAHPNRQRSIRSYDPDRAGFLIAFEQPPVHQCGV
jgi:hypothetical protein